jgi:hypothetical protein
MAFNVSNAGQGRGRGQYARGGRSYAPGRANPAATQYFGYTQAGAPEQVPSAQARPPGRGFGMWPFGAITAGRLGRPGQFGGNNPPMIGL